MFGCNISELITMNQQAVISAYPTTTQLSRMMSNVERWDFSFHAFTSYRLLTQLYLFQIVAKRSWGQTPHYFADWSTPLFVSSPRIGRRVCGTHWPAAANTTDFRSRASRAGSPVSTWVGIKSSASGPVLSSTWIWFHKSRDTESFSMKLAFRCCWNIHVGTIYSVRTQNFRVFLTPPPLLYARRTRATRLPPPPVLLAMSGMHINWLGLDGRFQR